MLATAVLALTSPELYIDWGSLAGALLVVPLCSLVAAVLVAIPLAIRKRISWSAVAVAGVTAVIAGELLFQISLNTPFARWSAARHWAAVERRAAADREATQREICRRLLAQPPVPPPPRPGVPAGRSVAPTLPNESSSLLVFDRQRCADLLGP